LGEIFKGIKMKRILALLLLVPTLALAWNPPKTVRTVIPFTPGSGNEMSFRAVAALVEKKHGIAFVIENPSGADGNNGMNQFAGRKPDGSSIAVPSCQSTFVAAEIHWSDMLKYTPYDLTFVTNIAKSPLAFIANSNSRVNTVPELIRDVQANNRKITFAVGSSAHKLAYEYFLDKVNGQGKQVVAANYKGPLPAAQDVAGGHAEFGIVPIAVASTLLHTGKIKVLGIAGEKRLTGFEKTSLMNQFVPGLNVYACWNIVLPPDTPAEIQDWYAKVFVEAINSAEAKKFFDANFMFVDPAALGPINVRKDMVLLKRQWAPYVEKMPSPR
jgi:tripartite-type tricarboxylate transporter receptor subunit TctC